MRLKISFEAECNRPPDSIMANGISNGQEINLTFFIVAGTQRYEVIPEEKPVPLDSVRKVERFYVDLEERVKKTIGTMTPLQLAELLKVDSPTGIGPRIAYMRRMGLRVPIAKRHKDGLRYWDFGS